MLNLEIFHLPDDPDDEILEYDIQLLYQQYPYLIDRRFLNVSVTPQYPLPSGFADLVVFLDQEVIAIELKIDPLLPKYALQLYDYLQDLHLKFPNHQISGILLGKAPKTDITPLLSSLSFPIQVKILVKDVPIHVRICKSCRLAIPSKSESCTFCSCHEWLK